MPRNGTDGCSDPLTYATPPSSGRRTVPRAPGAPEWRQAVQSQERGPALVANQQPTLTTGTGPACGMGSDRPWSSRDLTGTASCLVGREIPRGPLPLNIELSCAAESPARSEPRQTASTALFGLLGVNSNDLLGTLGVRGGCLDNTC